MDDGVGKLMTGDIHCRHTGGVEEDIATIAVLSVDAAGKPRVDINFDLLTIIVVRVAAEGATPEVIDTGIVIPGTLAVGQHIIPVNVVVIPQVTEVCAEFATAIFEI